MTFETILCFKKKRFLGKGNRSAQNLTEFNCLGTSVIVYPARSLHLRVVSWRAQSTARHFTHTHTHYENVASARGA